MRQFRGFFKLFVFTLLLPACEKDWGPVAPWEEMYAVYGTLNLKDTAQYIRINRVFSANDDLSNYYQHADSVNIVAADFEVWMEAYSDGQIAGPNIIFNPSSDYIKDDGLFATGHYNTFKTIERLKVGYEYKLFVKHKKTDYIMSATTDLLGLRTLDQAFKEMRYTNVTQYKPEAIDYWGSLRPGQFEKTIQRLLYYEYTPTDTFQKVLNWRPWLDAQKNGSKDTAVQLTNDYLKYIAENIPVNPNVQRKAVGVDKILILNSEELQLFIELTSQQGTLHYDPGYTNFDRGTGIIASRYYYTYFGMLLNPVSVDSLVYGRFTKHLGFIDSWGNQSKDK